MKALVGIMCIALLVSLNGCMTDSAIQEAEGHPELARSDWSQFGRPATPSPSQPPPKPHPAYYALLPLTIPADIALYPVQAFAWFVNCP